MEHNYSELQVKFMHKAAANALILFVKCNGLHFLVKGYNFQESHLVTENYYDHFKLVYDWINERLVQLGEKPVVSLVRALKLQEIEETSTDIKKVKEVYSILDGDFRVLKNIMLNLKEASAKAKDYVTEDYCIGQLRFLDKELWFMQSKLFNDLQPTTIVANSDTLCLKI